MLAIRKAIAMVLALIAQMQAEQKNFQPVDVLSGTDSAIERTFATMVTTEKQFIQLWREHKEIFEDPQSLDRTIQLEAQVPKVDFSKHIVLAYFAGQTQGVSGYAVASIQTKGQNLIVRIAPETFSSQIGITANSYGMWVFPRPKKAIEFELITGMKQGQPITKPLGRFEPPKSPKA